MPRLILVSDTGALLRREGRQALPPRPNPQLRLIASTARPRRRGLPSRRPRAETILRGWAVAAIAGLAVSASALTAAFGFQLLSLGRLSDKVSTLLALLTPVGPGTFF